MFDDGLRFDGEYLDGQLILCVSGEIDLVTAPTLKIVLDRTIDSSNRLTLDLSGITFMDSSGLHVITDAATRLRETGGVFSIIAVSEQVRRVLAISGVGDYIGFAAHAPPTGTNPPLAV